VAIYSSVSAKQSSDVVNEITGLPHPKVTSMVEFNAKVYVGTWGGGLGVYDVAGDSWTQIRVAANGLTDPFISEVAISPTESKLYFATNDGVTIYAPGTNSFAHFSTVDEGLPEEPAARFDAIKLRQALVSAVEVTEDAGVVQRWYGPRIDVKLAADEYQYHGITVSKSPATEYMYNTTNSGLEEPNVNDIYYDAVSGQYWVCYSSRGISAVDVTSRAWVDYTLVQGLPSNTVVSITRAHGTLWAATQGGLARLMNGGRWQGYARSAGLQADRTRRVYSDDGDRLWVAFVEGGAARVNPASAE
jgi:ligand-binding sensor domain-containing protein